MLILQVEFNTPEKTDLAESVHQRGQEVMDIRAVRIKCMILRKGMTLKSLSLKAGLSSRACSKALTAPFPAAEEAIAEFLGVPAQKLWPSRFNTDGSRKRSRHNQYKGIRIFRQCQNDKAA